MLRKKMIRDIIKLKVQFLSVFLMAFLGSFIYAGVNAEYTGIDTLANDFYKTTHAAGVWIYGRDINEEKLKKIEGLDGVAGIEKRLELPATTTLAGKPSLQVNTVSENKISQAYIIKGAAFSKNSKGIYLSEKFAKAHDIKLGDSISFELMGREMSYPVEALITSPDYVYYAEQGDWVPNYKNYGYAYVTKSSLPAAMQSSYSEILVDTKTDDSKALTNKIEKIVGAEASAILSRDEHPSYNTLSGEIAQHQAMGTIFPIAFLLIAILTVLTTMVRLINSQRSIISTLKALGFKRRKILFHYISYGFVISFAGAVLGVIIGPFSLPYLFYPAMSDVYALPVWQPVLSWRFLWMPILLVAVCTGITYLVCRRYVNESPALGMRLQTTTKKKMKASFIERLWFWKHLGFSNRWNLRDIFRNKARSAMAIIGIAGCTGMLLCAFGTRDSINSITNWQFRELNHYKNYLKLDESATAQQLANLDSALEGEFMMEQPIEVKAGTERKSGSLFVYEDDNKLSSLKRADKEVIPLRNGEVSMSQKLAGLLDISEGDSVSWRIYGEEKWIRTKIKHINYSPTSQGLSMDRTSLENAGQTFHASSFVTNDSIAKERSYAGVSNIWSQAQLEKETDSRLEMMNILTSVLILAAVLMALIVLYCLGIISFAEKYHDFATLKVLGFKTKTIRWLLIQQNIYLAVISIPFGFLFGVSLILAMLADMGDGLDILMYISPQTWLLCGFMSLVITLLVSILFSRRAKRIDMVAALKADE